MRRILVALVLLLAGAYSAGAADITVNIDKTIQEMTVFVDGTEQYRWPVSTGTRGYDTPSGTFQASSMNEMWYSKQWDNAGMPHSVFFTKEGHAIHGTDQVKNLGTAASHGCVRLSKENAEIFYRLVEENGLESTQVSLVGEISQEEYSNGDPEMEPEYPQQNNVEPRYDNDNSYNDYREPPEEPRYDNDNSYDFPYAPPIFNGGPNGFEFFGPGIQFQFKFDRRGRGKRERKRWRRYRD